MAVIKWRNLLLFCLVCIFSTSYQAATAITVVFRNDTDYQGTDDTFVRSGNAFSGGMSNFGKCATIEINAETRIGLIRFDVSSLKKKYLQINSVTLRLFSKNAPQNGSVSAHRLNIANSAWREGGNCGGTVFGGNRHEATWFHLADYGGLSSKPSWASGTAGPTDAGIDYDDEALGVTDNLDSSENTKFDIEFDGDLNGLIDDWSISSPIQGLRDRGGNPCWTSDWNWTQPAPETTNEGILLKGSDNTTHIFHSSEVADKQLRPQLIVTYSSTFEIIKIIRDPDTGAATIQFSSSPGEEYAVDASYDLNTWEELDDGVIGEKDKTEFVDDFLAPDNEGGELFYRVRTLD